MVYGLGFRIQDLGFRVQGLRLRFSICIIEITIQGFGLSCWGVWFMVLD
jgi:hypothetical protein